METTGYKSVTIMKQSIVGNEIHSHIISLCDSVNAMAEQLQKCENIEQVNSIAANLNAIKIKINDYKEALEDKTLSDGQKKDFEKQLNDVLEVVVNLLK